MLPNKEAETWLKWQLASVCSIASPKHCQSPQAANNHRSFYSSFQETPSPAQVMADTGLHQSTSQEDPEPKYLLIGFRPHKSITQSVLQMIHLKGSLGWYQSPAKATPAPWGLPLHESSSSVVMASPYDSQPQGQPHLLMCQ